MGNLVSGQFRLAVLMRFKRKKEVIQMTPKAVLLKYLRTAQIPNQIITTSEYWDCECKKDYIHHHSRLHCSMCLKYSHEQPDSRLVEVVDYLLTTISN